MLDILNLNEQKIKLEKIHVEEIKEYLKLLDLIYEINLKSFPGINDTKKNTVIAQPGLRYAQATSLVESLLKDKKFNELTLNFLYVLLDNRRFYLIDKIYEEYEKLLLDIRNTVNVKFLKKSLICTLSITSLISLNSCNKGPSKDYIDNAIAIVYQDEKPYLINANKETYALDYYEEIEQSFNDYIAVKYEGKYGFIDKTGKQTVPTIYDKVYPMSEEKAVVIKDGSYLIIDCNGNTLYTFTDSVISESYFKEDHLIVNKGDLYGYLCYNKADKSFTLSEIIYDQVKPFHEGFAVVGKKESEIIYKEDEQGNLTEEIEEIRVYENIKYNYVNTDFELLFEDFTFDYADSFYNNYAVVGYYDTITSPYYDDNKTISTDGLMYKYITKVGTSYKFNYRYVHEYWVYYGYNDKRLERKKEDVIYRSLCLNCHKNKVCYSKDGILKDLMLKSIEGELNDDEVSFVNKECLKPSKFFDLSALFKKDFYKEYKYSLEYKGLKEALKSQLNGLSNVITSYKDTLLLDHSLNINYENELVKRELDKHQFDVMYVNVNKDLKDNYFVNLCVKIMNHQLIYKIRDLISNVLNINLEIKLVSNFSVEGFLKIELNEVKEYKFTYGVYQINLSEEGNGDSYLIYENNNYMIYCLSDGMGVGKLAQEESRFTLRLLKSILETGMDLRNAIMLINSLLKVTSFNSTSPVVTFNSMFFAVKFSNSISPVDKLILMFSITFDEKSTSEVELITSTLLKVKPFDTSISLVEELILRLFITS